MKKFWRSNIKLKYIPINTTRIKHFLSNLYIYITIHFAVIVSFDDVNVQVRGERVPTLEYEYSVADDQYLFNNIIYFFPLDNVYIL